MEKDLTQDRLKELLHYDSETGSFKRNLMAGSRKKGSDAGGSHSAGYTRISVDNKRYLAHRLAWIYMTGAWPKNDIDHINGIRTDNRFCNLRDVTVSVNMQNQKRARSNNKSCGLLGVTFVKKTGLWRAQIQSANKTRLFIGDFSTPEIAQAAYLEKKREIHEGCTI